MLLKFVLQTINEDFFTQLFLGEGALLGFFILLFFLFILAFAFKYGSIFSFVISFVVIFYYLDNLEATSYIWLLVICLGFSIPFQLIPLFDKSKGVL